MGSPVSHQHKFFGQEPWPGIHQGLRSLAAWHQVLMIQYARFICLSIFNPERYSQGEGLVSRRFSHHLHPWAMLDHAWCHIVLHSLSAFVHRAFLYFIEILAPAARSILSVSCRCTAKFFDSIRLQNLDPCQAGPGAGLTLFAPPGTGEQPSHCIIHDQQNAVQVGNPLLQIGQGLLPVVMGCF